MPGVLESEQLNERECPNSNCSTIAVSLGVVRFGATLAMLAFLLVPVLTQAAATPDAIVGLVQLTPPNQTRHASSEPAQFTVWASTAIGIPLANACGRAQCQRHQQPDDDRSDDQ